MTGAVSLGGGRQLKQYITRLLYAIILVMPLYPWLGGIRCVIVRCPGRLPGYNGACWALWGGVFYLPSAQPDRCGRQ